MTDSVHRYVQEEQWQCSAPILIDGGDTLSIGHWCPSLGANKSLCPRPRPSNAHRWIYSPLANNRMVIPPRWVTERWEIFALNPADSPLLLLCWQQCTENGDGEPTSKSGGVAIYQMTKLVSASSVSVLLLLLLLHFLWLMVGRFNEPTQSVTMQWKFVPQKLRK